MHSSIRHSPARGALRRLLAAGFAIAALAACSRAQQVDTAGAPVTAPSTSAAPATAGNTPDPAATSIPNAPALGPAERTLPPELLTDTASLTLAAVLSQKRLYVLRRGRITTWYDVAIGKELHPTPTGNFTVKRLIWNPAWVPPDEEWARDKQPRGPKDPANPMKAVKIFFREPDYYIHGTGDLASLGSAASHGCLRMHPEQAARLAQSLMDLSGVSWDWSRIRRLLHLGDTKTVNLKHPVRMVVLQGEPILEANASQLAPAGTP
jgi:lipoprotein-anchoring transpeptidase ErfK/SrfK